MAHTGIPAGVGAKEILAIRCGQLIDGRSDQALAKTTIIVRNGLIEAIGQNLPVPAEAQVVDLGNATCLPGLMDLHVHLTINPTMRIDDQYFHRSEVRKALDGLRNAQKMLNAGFTTLRLAGEIAKYNCGVDLRDAIGRGEFLGPRLVVAPHLLTATGGHADLTELAGDVLSQAVGPCVSGPESGREAVRQEVKYGADWIKVCVTGGVMSKRDDPRVTSFTDEEVRAMVDEAHRYQKKVCVHAHGTEGIKQAIRAGVDSVEHGTLIDEEGIRLMKERSTYLVPTLYVMNYVIEQGAKQGFDPTSIAKGKALIDLRNRNIQAAFSAGLKLAFGTDTIFPHEQAGREFALLVQLGLTPMQAIQTATSNAANLLGLEKEIGTVEAGKRADIIAVSENPLANILALENVQFVLKDGIVIKNEFAVSPAMQRERLAAVASVQ